MVITQYGSKVFTRWFTRKSRIKLVAPVLIPKRLGADTIKWASRETFNFSYDRPQSDSKECFSAMAGAKGEIACHKLRSILFLSQAIAGHVEIVSIRSVDRSHQQSDRISHRFWFNLDSVEISECFILPTDSGQAPAAPLFHLLGLRPVLGRQSFVLVLSRSTLTFLPKLNYFDWRKRQ